MSSFDFYRLPNGVRVMLVPMAGVESVAVGVYMGVGARYETENINGISHFLEHMVFKGTAKFPTHSDTSYLEGLGAIQNAWTDVDATAYWCKIPANRWKEGLEVVKELALYPTFPEADLEIERGTILEEINRSADKPEVIVGEELFRLMFAGNTLERTILGKPEVIKAVTRQDFVDYHAKHYLSGNALVVLAGKIDIEGTKQQIISWFGDLPEANKTGFDMYRDTQTQSEVTIFNKDLSNQAHIELAVRGLTLDDPRRFALAILTSYLGEGLSSRLFVELREKRGLCYAVRAAEQKMKDTGVWSVYAGVALSKLDEAVKAILVEMTRLKEVKLTEAELLASKEKLRGPFLFSSENPINQMEYFARQALERPEEILSYQQVIDKLMAVTAEEIQNVAQSIFVTQKLNLAVVGPLEPGRKEELHKLLQV
ncbi:MAG: pitrilysin family protein [Patescibacteria group bacterium]